MTGSDLLDRIGRDLEDALRRHERRAAPQRRRRLLARLLIGVGILATTATAAAASGVGPFDRLFANDSVSRPSRDPGTIEVSARTVRGTWSVIAYRRRDDAIGLAAALDREAGRLPPVNWMGVSGLALAFEKLGPVSVRVRRASDGSRLVYGLVKHGAQRVSVTVAGREVPVFLSDTTLSTPTATLTGERTDDTLVVAVFAAPRRRSRTRPNRDRPRDGRAS